MTPSTPRHLPLCLLLTLFAPALTPALRAAPQGKTTIEITTPATDTKDVLAINGNDDKKTVDAAGRDVTINGNRNQIVLSGDCRTLTITGNENTVIVAGVASISLPGNRNKVTWTKAATGETPPISDLGNGNQVTRQPAR